VERYNGIQLEREGYMDSINRLYPDLYAVRIMNAFRRPFIPGELSHPERNDTLKHCFFDRVAIDDPDLLYAPVYAFRLMEYLSLYQVDTLSKSQQEKAFILALDRLMLYVGPAPELREFVLSYLLEGFEVLDMEEVQMHLAGDYLDQSCESDMVELVDARMKGYKKMLPGKQAPDILLRDVEGIPYQLSELGNSYVLVLFWASSCVHCQDMLPDLANWYQHERSLDLEVLAISIDSSESNFSEACSHLNLPWINSHEPLGWQGKVPSDYHVYATPVMFLLDGERTILARPSNFRQFLRAIRKLEH
jgi:thiol-disulfide isomerase/thioredoxin